jgi:hypothetical protein
MHNRETTALNAREDRHFVTLSRTLGLGKSEISFPGKEDGVLPHERRQGERCDLKGKRHAQARCQSTRSRTGAKPVKVCGCACVVEKSMDFDERKASQRSGCRFRQNGGVSSEEEIQNAAILQSSLQKYENGRGEME